MTYKMSNSLLERVGGYEYANEGKGAVYMMCVCVCVRERERGRGGGPPRIKY